MQQLWQELGSRAPTHDEICQRAYNLWLQRKDEQARQDWHDAEEFVKKVFRVV